MSGARVEGLCQCGCGEPTTISPVSDRRLGYVKGKPRRFVKGHNARLPANIERMRRLGPIVSRDPERNRKLSEAHKGKLAGPKSHFWRGGRRRRRGYVMVWMPHNPMADGQGYVLEHRLVMAAQLGRPLNVSESVHHRNGVRDDNRTENLELRSRYHGAGATHCPHCGGALA